MKRVVVFLPALAMALFVAAVGAKLPPLSDEAKAKAAEASAKTAYNDKVGAYKLCKSMDKVVATYHAEAKKAGKQIKPGVATPPCTEPGPFAATSGPKPPLEAAGAHSPPKTATAPPSSNTPHAEQKPADKK
jgi:hypothetical protein